MKTGDIYLDPYGDLEVFIDGKNKALAFCLKKEAQGMNFSISTGKKTMYRNVKPTSKYVFTGYNIIDMLKDASVREFILANEGPSKET